MQGQCPHCKGQFEIKPEWIGLQSTCPYCQAQFIIQAPSPILQPQAAEPPQPGQPILTPQQNAAPLGAFECYTNAFKKYASFSGRASRREYWFFVLFNFLILLGVGILDGSFGAEGALVSLYQLTMLLPSLAITIRRLHDIDKSGWYFLLFFIPVIGPIMLLCFQCRRGTQGPNQYGEDPYAGQNN